MRHHDLIPYYLLSFITPYCHGNSYATTAILFDTLLTNYRRDIRPMRNQSEVLNINFTISVSSLSEVQVSRQEIGMNIYLVCEWYDEILVWDPRDYENITFIYPESDSIWLPNVQIENSLTNDLQNIFDLSEAMPIKVEYTGKVLWSVYLSVRTACQLDMTQFPYDSHACTFNFHAVTFTNDALMFRAARPEIILTYFIPNGEWEIVSSSFQEGVFVFFNLEKYGFFSMQIRIRRLPGFFIINLLFPICALSLLNIFVFLIPADSGEKMSYSITVLLSMMFFLSLTNAYLPSTSVVVPLVTQYLTALTIISVLTVFVTVFILIFHHKTNEEKKRTTIKERVIGRWKRSQADRKKKEREKVKVSRPFRDTALVDRFMSWGKKRGLRLRLGRGKKIRDGDTDSREIVSPRSSQTNLKIGTTFITVAEKLGQTKNKEGEKIAEEENVGIPQSATPNHLPNVGVIENGDALDDHNDEVKVKDSSPPVSRSEVGQGHGPMFRYLARRIDILCFFVFLTVWCSVTLFYMVALFCPQN